MVLETDETKIAQAECKKVPILIVESEKSKINLSEVGADSIVDNLTLGKSTVTPSEFLAEQDSNVSYLDAAQEGQNKDLELFIHWGQTLLAPLTFQAFNDFKKALALYYAGEVMEGKVGQDINCGQAWYDRENRCAVIKCENEQSVVWFKKSILIIRVGKQCFRAWSFGERPKLFRLRAFLPDTYEHLDRNQIRAMIIHFNPEARDTLNLIGCVAVKKGRVVKLEIGPNFFEYCRVRDGKLNFLLGKINCSVSNVFIPDTENLTSEMEVEPTKEIGCESNVDQRENLRNEFSIEKLPEPNSEPMGGPLSPASAAAVEELMSEAEERAKKDSEGWINVFI